MEGIDDLTQYKSLESVELKGKTVLIRVDLNSNVVDYRVVISDRMRKHSKAIKGLAEKGARVVVLSHQGRHKGDDYISLKQHTKRLSELTDRAVDFAPIDEEVGRNIKKLKDGEIVLLENTRFMFEEKQKMSAEEHSKHAWVKIIAENCDLFVQDALSICHRSHASVVGFAPHLPCFIGPTLERELREINDQLSEKDNPKIFVLSGFKLEEPISLMKRMLDEGRTDYVLCGGMMGKTLMKAKGLDLGAENEFMARKGFNEFIPLVKPLLEKYGDKIILPVDLAVEVKGKRQEISVDELPSENRSYDIGEKTIELFKEYISKAKCLTLNGPLGVMENAEFRKGTKEVFDAICESQAHSILGGGQTLEALKELGFGHDDFGLVSLAGGALLDYLSGKNLPGLSCLKQKISNSNGS